MNTQSTANPANLLEHLLTDNQWLEDVLGQLYAAAEMNNEATTKKLWAEFEWDLSAHLRAEEAFLIPALRRSDEYGTRMMLEGHKNLRARMAELGVRVDLGFIPLDVVCRAIDDLRAHARLGDSLWSQLNEEPFEEPQRDSLIAAIVDTVHQTLVVRSVAA